MVNHLSVSALPWRVQVRSSSSAPTGCEFPRRLVGRAQCGILRSVWYIRSMSTERLTPTSYLVLGLLAREGPSTRTSSSGTSGHAGQLLVVPATLLYSEPSRLAALGLVDGDTRDRGPPSARLHDHAGRARLPSARGSIDLRRADRAARPRAAAALLRATWRPAEAGCASPSSNSPSTRRSWPPTRRTSASRTAPVDRGRGQRTVEHWRGETLPMGLLYERAAVEFWAGVVNDARAAVEPEKGEDARTNARRRDGR